MPKVKINDVDINYTVKGEAAENIVFIHGLGENIKSWKHQLRYFSKSFTVIALDLRGHGKSGIPEKRIEMQDFSKDVIGLLNYLEIKDAHFCGLSMGALLIFETYKKYPNRFSSMILVSTRPCYPPTETGVLEGVTMEEIGKAVAGFALAPSAAQMLKEETAKMISQTRKDMYIQSAEASSLVDYTGLLLNIKVPTLIIVGELDVVTPLNHAKLLNKLIQTSTLEIMAGVGHLPNRENPEGFNKILEAFLNKIKYKR